MADNIRLGLKENWQAFALLVIVNAFVGGMVGMERTLIPQYAELQFGMESKAAILSFIVAFGFSKAIANYYTGQLVNRFGRKRLLLLGWILALPAPWLLIYAPNWSWVVLANILLGIHQGFAWSSTVIMKIDIVGEKNRGLAMGLNEFAGYLSVGLVALITGRIADKYGIVPHAFYVGVLISLVGFVITVLWVKDTTPFVRIESIGNKTPQFSNVFLETSFTNKTLSAVTQAGLVNNLNDGMIWGLLPIMLLSMEYDNRTIGIIASIYPTVWGLGQLFTGWMSDQYAKKGMLFWGMFLQGIAILLLPFSHAFYALVALSTILGLGTALVYPTFLSAITEATHPKQRAESIGTFRLWRDAGYAFGAIVSGVTADAFGVVQAVLLVGLLTIASGLVIKYRMPARIRDAAAL